MGKQPYSQSSILSEFADTTCRSLAIVCAEFERETLIGSGISKRSRRSRLLDGIARCIGITEYFVFGRIVELVERHVEESGNRMLAALYKQHASKLDNSWQSIVMAADDYLGLTIKGMAQYDQVMAYVEVRNAAMHGNGSLTRRQARDPSVREKIGSIGVRVIQGRLEVEDSHLLLASRDCRSLTTELDGKTWSAGQRIS